MAPVHVFKRCPWKHQENFSTDGPDLEDRLTGVLMITAHHSVAHAGSLMLNGTEPLLLSDIPPVFVVPSQVKTPAVQPVQNVGR